MCSTIMMTRWPRPLSISKNTKYARGETYISDPDGTYRFPALSPNVDYEIYAEMDGARSEHQNAQRFR